MVAGGAEKDQEISRAVAGRQVVFEPISNEIEARSSKISNRGNPVDQLKKTPKMARDQGREVITQQEMSSFHQLIQQM